MSNNGDGTSPHPFYPVQRHEPVWNYFRCNKCYRMMVTGAVVRG